MTDELKPDKKLRYKIMNLLADCIDSKKAFSLYATEIISLVREHDKQSHKQEGWISVESHMPRTKGKYDVWVRSHRIADQWFNGKVFTDPKISHWMEVKPPKEKP